MPRGCSSGCSKCEINGQLRLRRNLRLCENPAPNFGGADCPGSDTRGLLCERQICSGISANEYAVQVCTKIRDEGSAPDLLLTGRGIQYPESPCRVWCHMALQNFIRAVANLPDGTPCGPNKYCVKGDCKELSCNLEAVVNNTGDCPNKVCF